MPDNHLIMIFLSFIGFLFILFALLNNRLLRWMGFKPLSEVFTNPNFQRSAKITGNLGRLFLAVFGLGFLVQGIGPLFLSNEAAYTLSIILAGASGLIILVMVGVTLANWNAK